MTEFEVEMFKIIRHTFVTSEARLYEHVSTTFRWLMATLFAANGGAIIALLGSTQSGNVFALGWFAVGLILSIIMGILSCIQAFRAITSIDAARWSIDQSLLTRETDIEFLNNLVARLKLTWKTWVPSYAGGASLACLIIGMFAIACRL